MGILKKRFAEQDYTVESRQTAYQGFFEINRVAIKHKLFGGGWSDLQDREVFERGNAAGVVLFDPDRDEVVLQEQFRVGAMAEETGPWLFEIVAGVIDAGDTPEKTAIRECQEETGLKPDRLIPICRYFSSPGGSTEQLFLFCGLIDLAGAGGVFGKDDEGEDIQVHVVSTNVAFDMVRSGEINNAASIIALQWLQINRNQLEK